MPASDGVQGPGGVFVERVEGNYFNVIGMPLPMLSVAEVTMTVP